MSVKCSPPKYMLRSQMSPGTIYAVFYAMGKYCSLIYMDMQEQHSHSMFTFMHGEAKFLIFYRHSDFKFSG